MVTTKGNGAPVPTVSGHLPSIAKTGTVGAMRIPIPDTSTAAALAGGPALPE